MFADKVDQGEISLLCRITFFFIRWQSNKNKYAKGHTNLIYIFKKNLYIGVYFE